MGYGLRLTAADVLVRLAFVLVVLVLWLSQ